MPQSYLLISQSDWDGLNAKIDNIHVAKAHLFPGADAGLKITAAIASLPAGVGGIVDATGFPNPQNLTGFTVPRGVEVLLPPIFFTMFSTGPSIVVNEGGRLIGMGTNSPGATTIKPASGFNKDVIKCISSGGESSWWHHGEVRNIRILANKQQNALGHGLSVYGLAETSLIQRMSISDAAQAGLYIKGSQSGTGSIENVTVNTNGTYGVQLDEFRSAITLKCVGGDQNPITFGITNPSLGGGGILLIDPKSEGSIAVDPLPIQISGGSAKVSLTIMGGNFTTPNSNKTILRIAPDTGFDPSVQIIGLVSGNSFTTLIDDLKNAQTVSTQASTYHSLFTYCAGKYARFDETGFHTFPS